MIEKKLRCPNCGNVITTQGNPGEAVQLICTQCNQLGKFTFPGTKTTKSKIIPKKPTKNNTFFRSKKVKIGLVLLFISSISVIAAGVMILGENTPPNLSLSAEPMSGYQPLDVTFNIDANDPDGKINECCIDFGDGTTSNKMNPTHEYSAGTYLVVITVTDNEGAEISKSITIDVKNQAPTASISANKIEGISPFEVVFTGSGNDNDGNIVSYKWGFDDGATSDEKNPTHIFTSSGVYSVKLTVKDDYDETSSDTLQITVNEEPAEFEVSNLIINPDKVEPGETVDISVDVKNIGGIEGIKTLELTIDGESKIKSVTLDPGESKTIHFTAIRENEGTYGVNIEDLSSSFDVISSTKVGGIINQNTSWTIENSPYEIIDTVQIPSGVTLTIQPGVTVIKPTSEDMFLLNGEIYAHGNLNEKIIFKGGGNSNFFNPQNSDADTFLDMEYCIICDGKSFWPPTGHQQYGHFSLRHSELANLTDYSYIWYPKKDVHIEYNTFVNAGGFSIGHAESVKIYIRYNLFDGKNPSLPNYADYVIENWASYGESETIVKYNSFINIEGIALKLPSGYEDSAMSAINNYWGTQDTNIIDSMIYDKNDDITCAGYINYQPILIEPHPDTP